jgi:hypothetical protein
MVNLSNMVVWKEVLGACSRETFDLVDGAFGVDVLRCFSQEFRQVLLLYREPAQVFFH